MTSMRERAIHFGVLCYGGAGHLNSLLALCGRLKTRGHRITFFQAASLENRVRTSGFEFCAIGRSATMVERKHPRSSVGDLRYRIQRITEEMDMFLREAPDALAEAGIDALLIDEIALAGPTLAQLLGLPYVLVSTSVPHHFGWNVPRILSACDNPVSSFDRLKNALLQVSVLRMQGPVKWNLDRYRRRMGLGPMDEIDTIFPARAHVATLPECLDFPGSTRRPNFYYTGPFVDARTRPTVDFPWERLDGRPLVYVSLGTSRKIGPDVFGKIAEACEGLGLQVVMSLGGSRDVAAFANLCGEPLVVSEAPQLELIKIAAMVISHAGINTVLEALMEGRPMVAIPITHDQPALAARLAWLQVAEVIPGKRLTVRSLRGAVQKVLRDSSYGEAAREIQGKILAGRGLERAVEVIERCVGGRSMEQAAECGNDSNVTRG